MLSTQRLILIGAGLLLVAWLLGGHCLKLQARAKLLRSQIAGLNGRVEEARKTISGIQRLEEEADTARSEINQWERSFPPDPPMVWIPPRMKEHFRRYGFGEPVVRFDAAHADPELPNYRRLYGRIHLPLNEGSYNLRNLLNAVADIEETERLTKVVGLAIQPDPSNPQGRTAIIALAALIRK